MKDVSKAHYSDIMDIYDLSVCNISDILCWPSNAKMLQRLTCLAMDANLWAICFSRVFKVNTIISFFHK